MFNQHYLISNAFKDSMESLGLTFVPNKREYMANTLTAVRFAKGINGKEFLGYIKEYGVVFAGGLHKDIKTEYFRVGHMGISTAKGCDHILKSVQAVEYALTKVGYQFEKNTGVNTLLKTVAVNQNQHQHQHQHQHRGQELKNGNFMYNNQNYGYNHDGRPFMPGGEYYRGGGYSNYYANDGLKTFMSSFAGIVAGLGMGYLIAQQMKKNK